MNTCTVDHDTFEKLPDRTRLTGLPMPNQFYRDAADDVHVYKWLCETEARHPSADVSLGQWVTFLRIEP